MYKKIILIPLVLILIIASIFTGCIQLDGNIDTSLENKVEIVKWYNGTYFAIGNLYSNGFVYHEDAKLYIVNGTAKNNASRQIKTVTIHVKYYDINDNLLWDDGILENGIPPKGYWDFYSFYLSNQDHFEDVHHVKFEIDGELEKKS